MSLSAIDKIKADPYLHALGLTESGMDPLATNPNSSAKGIFQFINSTAKALGLQNPFNVEESLIAINKLREQDEARFGSDPATLYSAHYLGAPVLNRLNKGEKLTDKEQEQVDFLKEKALPRFMANYAKVISTKV